MLLGEGRVRLQHSALPQEVQKISVGSVFDGYVQVACKAKDTQGSTSAREDHQLQSSTSGVDEENPKSAVDKPTQGGKVSISSLRSAAVTLGGPGRSAATAGEGLGLQPRTPTRGKPGASANGSSTRWSRLCEEMMASSQRHTSYRSAGIL